MVATRSGGRQATSWHGAATFVRSPVPVHVSGTDRTGRRSSVTAQQHLLAPPHWARPKDPPPSALSSTPQPVVPRVRRRNQSPGVCARFVFLSRRSANVRYSPSANPRQGWLHRRCGVTSRLAQRPGKPLPPLSRPPPLPAWQAQCSPWDIGRVRRAVVGAIAAPCTGIASGVPRPKHFAYPEE